MLIDELCSRYDATRIESRVVVAPLPVVFAAVLRADFIEAWRGNPVVRGLFGLRSAAERVVSVVLRKTVEPVSAPETMRLADMQRNGEWVMLGQRPPFEVAFGAIGRFWGGQTSWLAIEARDFADFDRPGFAAIACNFSLRSYGDARTLVTYEARTRATDPDSSRAFLRYWKLVSPFVGVVMRSQLRVVAREAEQR